MTVLSSFNFYELIAPAAFIFAIGLTISLAASRSPFLSIFVSLFKSVLFMLYYGAIFDGTYTFRDDWVYLSRGLHLYNNGISSLNMFAHLNELFVQGGGKNLTYYLFNADSFRLFGVAYYAPVAINVALTFLASACIVGAAKRALGLTSSLGIGLFFFTTLQPDIVAWSTVMNGKDTLVLTCTSVAVYAIGLADSNRLRLAIVLGASTGFILLFTRFYVPLMLLGSLFAALMLSPYGRRKPFLWLLIPAALVAMLEFLGAKGLTNAHNLLDASFINPLYGVPRMLLTPIPFHTVEKYAFLNVPQTFHWLFLPIMLYGIYRIWKRATLTARFVVIYFVSMLLLYGMFDTLQGPRHRVQLDGLIALFQFYGAVGLLTQIAPWRGSISGLAFRHQLVTLSR